MSETKKIDIIIFNMSPYTDWQQGIVNRNYHILQALARDERVGKIVAVDFLPIGFSLARKAKYFYRNLVKGVNACDVDKNLCLGGETRFGDLTSRCYQITSKIYVYSSIDSLTRVTQELGEISKRLKLQNLIIWSYNPLIANLKEIKKQLKAKLIVFDAVDDWSSHSAYKNKKELLQKNYQQIQSQADLIFTVSQELKEKLFNNLDKAHWIPNGVDRDHFLKRNEMPEELQNIQQPIIGYAGVIQDRLDISLVKYLAETNRDKSFVFVGWLWRGLDEIINKKFVDLDNVHFLGRRTYDELPNYLQAFSVGIIPHKVNDLTKSMNPLKMYEYLACGKPIVSTEVSGVGDFGKFIKIAKNKEEFNQMINESLAEDNEELKKQRIEVVKKHSWESRMMEMMRHLEI